MKISLGPLRFDNDVLQGNRFVKYWQGVFSTIRAILENVQPLVVNNAFSIPLDQVPVYAGNAAAVAGGLSEGNLYRSGGDPDVLSIVH